MILLLLLALGLIGTSALLFLRAAGAASARRRQALEHIGAYGFNAEVVAEDRRPQVRDRLASLATVVGGLYNRYVPEQREREIRELLRSAGLYRMRVATFVGYRVLATVGMAVFWLWLVGAAGGGGVKLVFVSVCFAALGWIGPMFLLRQELCVALSEQSMGLTIQDALKNMLGRANSPALRVFVQAILQGETLGVSIGKILRDLAVDMRKRRRQSAEERAQKAPTKIIFPLVLLILPAIFIVAVGPLVFSFIHGLG
jgi:hypothetical protein